MSKLYAGIDLGLRFHQVVLVDTNGQRLGQPLQIGRGRRGIEQLLAHAPVSAARMKGKAHVDARVSGKASGLLTPLRRTS
ncbi:MAG: hypothetical protein OEN01_03175 [Candidatus Krumholzibacteria bacterium]|nr:hypothetical protein [Candidatus Krumholzibacteria bacterium]